MNDTCLFRLRTQEVCYSFFTFHLSFQTKAKERKRKFQRFLPVLPKWQRWLNWEGEYAKKNYFVYFERITLRHGEDKNNIENCLISRDDVKLTVLPVKRCVFFSFYFIRWTMLLTFQFERCQTNTTHLITSSKNDEKRTSVQTKSIQNEIRTSEKHLNMNWETKCFVLREIQSVCCCVAAIQCIDLMNNTHDCCCCFSSNLSIVFYFVFFCHFHSHT